MGPKFLSVGVTIKLGLVLRLVRSQHSWQDIFVGKEVGWELNRFFISLLKYCRFSSIRGGACLGVNVVDLICIFLLKLGLSFLWLNIILVLTSLVNLSKFTWFVGGVGRLMQ